MAREMIAKKTRRPQSYQLRESRDPLVFRAPALAVGGELQREALTIHRLSGCWSLPRG